ncbi:endochitinase-like [Anopheles albimanus]|uniref:Uncharacterized protein n=1 Tax=Anopheles albimanus TaxID=7167 RepID=A0A182FBI8_ANOAL|nr:endochitinase-like [Anopheles albimanus]
MRSCHNTTTLVVLWIALLLVYPASTASPKRLVCKFSSWSTDPDFRGNFTYDTKDIPVNLCTHVVYSFAQVDQKFFDIQPENPTRDILQSGYKHFTALKERQPTLRLLIDVHCLLAGCVTSVWDSNASSWRANREKFITSVVEFLETYRFDGIVISAYDRDDVDELYRLVDGLKQSFRNAGYASWEVITYLPSFSKKYETEVYQKRRICEVADYVIEGVSYARSVDSAKVDVPSPMGSRPFDTGEFMNLTVKRAIETWIRSGCPSEKILLEVPFHGRPFVLANARNRGPGSAALAFGQPGGYTGPDRKAYYEICQDLLDRSWTIEWDPRSMAPYAYRNRQWVGYENEISVVEKANYAIRQGLGGLYASPIDFDDFRGVCGKKHILLTALASTFHPNQLTPDESVDFAIFRG